MPSRNPSPQEPTKPPRQDPANPTTKDPTRGPGRGLPLFFKRWIVQSLSTLKQDDISSDADKSIRLSCCWKPLPPADTGWERRENKNAVRLHCRHSSKNTRSYTVTHRQLQQAHMSCHMQLHSGPAYKHTRHSRTPLRAQQVFTPPHEGFRVGRR